MQIVKMETLNQTQLAEAAQILTDELPQGWATPDEAMAEIKERLIPENTLLAAVEDGAVLGWCGILPMYDGHVFELHPLAVRHDRQRQGIGTALVSAAEQAARQRGGITLWLGTDDDKPGGETSFAGVDLYDGLPRRIAEFEPGTHQSAFYLKLGFKVVGVMPDADGPGKPDIFMAKRL